MYRRNVSQNLVLVMVLVIAFGVFSCFAAEPPQESLDEISITTYYPSPYGSYNQLEVFRSVTYKPLSSPPTSEPREGEVVYVDANLSDAQPGQFYYYGGGGWVAQGGGTAVMYLSCGWGVDF